MDWKAIFAFGAVLVSFGLPATVDAQQAATVYRIGRLTPLSADADAPNLEAFRQGMTELGWIEGKNFTIEPRYADGRQERLPKLAAELAQRRVDVILVGSNPGALAARKATSTIPIVMVTTGDPVGGGIVESLARPNGNLTGLTTLGHDLNAKRLELIKQALPHVAKVAVIANPVSADTAPFLRQKDDIARALGLELKVLQARDLKGLQDAFTTVAAARADAVMVLSDATFITNRREIVELVSRSRLPAVYPEREFVDVGGFIFYGASLADMYRHAADYADKILHGAKPSDLPIEQPTKLELVINLKAAKQLGLTIPQSLIVRADQVVQ